MTKVIALVGYGQEARSAARYFSKLYPDAIYKVYDQANEPPADLPQGAKYMVDNGQPVLDIEADIVVRTPSVHTDRIKTTGQTTSVTSEFFAHCPVPIIGVTGTKGKGTTSSLIAHILEKAGTKVWLVGNIGQPALDMLEEIQDWKVNGGEGIVVYELSSFQLWDLKVSPHIAVVLMIEPEHLDVHGDDDNYIDAKSNITRYQKPEDVVVYFAKNQLSTQIAMLSPGRKKPYRGEDVSVSTSELKLRGPHNLENIAAAVRVARELVEDTATITAAVRDFSGLPHRLESVPSSKADITFINDSYSSAPPATLAAIKSFEQPEVVIIGGKDRGLNFDLLARGLKERANIKKVILIGEAKQRLADSFKQNGFNNFEMDESNNFEAIARRAAVLAEPGDVVLLSPGCASFDMFENFTERGETFKKIVSSL